MTVTEAFDECNSIVVAAHADLVTQMINCNVTEEMYDLLEEYHRLYPVYDLVTKTAQ